MKLTQAELNWVNERMKIYDIKYQEIYNELLDHILTALERQRDGGDTREIALLFQDVVDEHFGGYSGIETVAQSNVKAYNNKVKHLIWANFKYYLNLKTFVLILAAIIVGYVLPVHKLMLSLLFSAIVLAAFFPLMYAFIRLRSIRPSKGKSSLVYSYITLQASLPVTLFNCIVFIPRLFSDNDNFNAITQLPPSAIMVVLAITVIFGLSCIRLCKQELKSVVTLS